MIFTLPVISIPISIYLNYNLCLKFYTLKLIHFQKLIIYKPLEKKKSQGTYYQQLQRLCYFCQSSFCKKLILITYIIWSSFKGHLLGASQIVSIINCCFYKQGLWCYNFRGTTLTITCQTSEALAFTITCQTSEALH